MSKPSVNDIPSCCNICKGPLICELQLLSSLIPHLKESTSLVNVNSHDKKSLNLQSDRNFDKIHNSKDMNIEEPNSCIEFGTVMIYTCQNSCWSHKDGKSSAQGSDVTGNYFQEHIFLQSETL